MAITIATLNVNGLRDSLKRDLIFDYLTRQKIGISLIQETHSESRDEVSWQKQWGGDIFFSHGSRQSKGVAILVSNKIGLKLTNKECDTEGRWVKGQIHWNEQNISLVSVYAPNNLYLRRHFFQNIAKLITRDCKWIIGGDFNCQLDSDNRQDGSVVELQNLIEQNDLLDTWRNIQTNNPGYTYYNKKLRKPTRIDYILSHDTFLNQVKDITVSTVGITDHRLINLRLDNSETIKGPGRWLCNNTLLKVEECNNRIINLWKFWKTKKKDYNNVLDWWDRGKLKVKEIISDYGKEKFFQEKQSKAKLQKAYENKIRESATSSEIKELETQLKMYEIKEWEKARVRMHITQKTEGEKPSKFFLSLEKQRLKDNQIKGIRDKNGRFVNKPLSMIGYIREYYKNLFTSEKIDYGQMQKILNVIKPSQLDDALITDIEKDITETDLTNALKQMTKGKSPGKDGLTVDFYLEFWPVIKDDFLEVINECKNKGCLSRSMNNAIIRLIFKNKGEKEDLRNWRPISLLNVDYKIIAKTITNKLSKLMPHIIGEEQTCGVKNRKIQDNLIILRDVIDYVNVFNKQGAVLCIDQEKAFDRVEWNFLFSVMDKVGIPASLINWISILYSNPSSSIIVNNFMSEPFVVSRGIRQGCPLSPLLYAISAEGLSSLIRTEKRLKGIIIPSIRENFKLVQHADDTTIFVTNDNEFPIINDIFTLYSEGSGSKINIPKTTGLWLGSWKSRLDNPTKYKFVNNHLKILGITFGNQVRPEVNWDPRINKIKSTLNRWKYRDLTLNGKAIIVNTLCGAGLNYLGSVIHCPKDQVQQIEKIIWNYYWSGKKDKIKRNTITGPKEKGGTGIINISYKLHALKLKWITRYIKEKGKWRNLMNFWICKASDINNLKWFIFNNKQAISARTPVYYHEMIKTFSNAGGKINFVISCRNEATEIPLWKNNLITFNGKKFDSPALKRHGYNTLGDLIGKNGFKTHIELARMCNLRSNDVGRILSNIKSKVSDKFVKENRQGPANHICNMLKIPNFSNDEEISMAHTTVKEIYQNLIAKTFEPPISEIRWTRVFQLSHTPDWKEIWKRNQDNILSHEDRDLWFKIKHRILPTKDRLFKMKITEDNKCTFCRNIETIEHLFLYCPIVMESWINMENILRKYTGNQHFFLNDNNRILGYGVNMNSITLLLIVKLLRVIWAKRCEATFKVDNSPVKSNDILRSYQKCIKGVILLESKRLSKNAFKLVYGKNQALCKINDDKIVFSF